MYLLYQAASVRNWHEVYLGLAQFFWIGANFWWMSGEFHDIHYPDEPSVYAHRVAQCGYVMNGAMVVVGIFFLVIKPLNLLKISDEAAAKYDHMRGILTPRWPLNHRLLFPTWREYEQACACACACGSVPVAAAASCRLCRSTPPPAARTLCAGAPPVLAGQRQRVEPLRQRGRERDDVAHLPGADPLHQRRLYNLHVQHQVPSAGARALQAGAVPRRARRAAPRSRGACVSGGSGGSSGSLMPTADANR